MDSSLRVQNAITITPDVAKSGGSGGDVFGSLADGTKAKSNTLTRAKSFNKRTNKLLRAFTSPFRSLQVHPHAGLQAVGRSKTP